MGLSPAHELNSRLPPKNPFQSMRSKPTHSQSMGLLAKLSSREFVTRQIGEKGYVKRKAGYC